MWQYELATVLLAFLLINSFLKCFMAIIDAEFIFHIPKRSEHWISLQISCRVVIIVFYWYFINSHKIEEIWSSIKIETEFTSLSGRWEGEKSAKIFYAFQLDNKTITFSILSTWNYMGNIAFQYLILLSIFIIIYLVIFANNFMLSYRFIKNLIYVIGIIFQKEI